VLSGSTSLLNRRQLSRSHTVGANAAPFAQLEIEVDHTCIAAAHEVKHLTGTDRAEVEHARERANQLVGLDGGETGLFEQPT
jgi:hypothetical protein